MKNADAHTAPPRPLWGSPAGKARMAKQLVARLPPHTTYVEPFAGSAAVLYAKPAAAVEVVSDIDTEIVDGFRMAKSLTEGGINRLRNAD